MTAFVLNAKKLLLLKLDGEPSFGIRVKQRSDAHGHRVFLASRVDRLSPSDRAGITRGDQLLSVKVVGVDARAYAWSDGALDRIESLHEIYVIEICIKKPDGTRITDAQLRHRDRISHLLTKAKVLNVSNKRVRGAYTPLQLKRAVVLIYDYEHAHFAMLWKALPELDRAAITIPMARDFVSETRLPGLADDAETREPPPTPTPSLPATPEPAPPLSPVRTDADATESIVGSPRESVQSQEDTQSTSGRTTTATMTGSSDSSFLEIEEDTTPSSPPRQRPRLMTARTAAHHSIGARRETSSARRRRRRLFEASDEESDGEPDDVLFIKAELVQKAASHGDISELDVTRD